jgi:hypothetical protein
MFGQVVKAASGTDNLLKIDCSGLSAGVYIVSVRTAINVYSSKFVIN